MIRLDAVNRILVSAQLVTVTTLSSPDRLVAKAITILDDTVLRELERGWDFNQDYDYEVTLSGGNFNIPTTPWTVLAIDVRPENSGSKEIIARDGKLYDKTNRTFTFTEATMKCDITWVITFDNCPLVFQEYAVACACVRFAVEVSVDPQVAAQLRANEARAWHRLKQADTQQASVSIFQRWPLSYVSRRWPTLLK